MEVKSTKFEFEKSYLKGKIFIYPSDTCYGLGCFLSDEEAVKKIYKIKGRDLNKPLSIMVKDKRMFKRYGVVDKSIEKLIDKHLPGCLTIVVKKTEKVPQFFNLTADNIGIRIPNNKFCLRLVKIAKEPIITTSANISGEGGLYNSADILREFSGKNFDERPNIFFNDGELKKVASSTVVQFKDGALQILRQGSLKI